MKHSDVTLSHVSGSSASNVPTVNIFAFKSRDVETFLYDRAPSKRLREKGMSHRFSVVPSGCGRLFVFVARMGSQGNPACKKSSAVEEAIIPLETASAVLHHVKTLLRACLLRTGVLPVASRSSGERGESTCVGGK